MQFCALKKLNRLSHIRSKKAKDATNVVSQINILFQVGEDFLISYFDVLCYISVV